MNTLINNTISRKKRFIIVVIIFLSNILIVNAVLANAPMIDRGDGYAVYPNSQKKKSEEIKELPKSLFEFMQLFNNSSTDSPSPGVTTPTTSPSGQPFPSQTPSGQPVNQSFLALRELKEYVSEKVGVPVCVLETISCIEYPSVYRLSSAEIQNATQPGQKIPNCPWNSCSAAGHMQMTTGIDERGSTVCSRCCWQGSCLNYCPDAWGSYGNAVKQFDGATHTPNVCNLRDSEFAAAKKLKTDSNTAPGDLNWSWDAIFRAGKRYYGNCTVKYDFNNRGCGVNVPQKMTYCEFIQYQCNL